MFHVWTLQLLQYIQQRHHSLGSIGTVASFSYYALFICAYKYGLTNYFMNIIEQSPLNVVVIVIVVEDDDDASSISVGRDEN